MMMTPNNHDVDESVFDDELDALLRTWHDVNAERARARRDALLRSMTPRPLAASRQPAGPTHRNAGSPGHARSSRRSPLARLILSPYARAAASVAILVALATMLIPAVDSPAIAQEIMIPDGGRLEALDERGNLIGPCALEHTDVDVSISGHFARVTLQQRFHNTYDTKIEAVYTFPLSHRAAVDRMTMTIGDRVAIGEVKERAEARRIYEAARDQGYVASLLEQERPNIFTQSVANIEPDAEVLIEISYVELLQVRDGEYRFDFPMTVAPRYIPGSPTTSPAIVPAELQSRHGVILRACAALVLGEPGDTTSLGTLQIGKLDALLHAARPIEYPGAAWWGEGEHAKLPDVWYPFEATYADGSKEIGWLYTDGTGQINGRWFYTDPKTIADLGTGFSPNTNRVPDASRITPMPARPPKRAGHDIAVNVSIDTGGPGIIDLDSESHEIRTTERVIRDDDTPNRIALELAAKRELPNRHFLLSWRQTADRIEEAHFVHTGDAEKYGEYAGGFFTLILQPPDRVDEADIRPRELIFVLDSSGSMKNQPIAKAKDVMLRAIDTMRPDDTFNVITFNDTTDVLWDAPRPNTDANRAEAKRYVDSRQGGGGTEMRQAVLAALEPRPHADAPLTPAELANLPADGRRVEVCAPLVEVLSSGDDGDDRIRVRDDLSIALRMLVDLPSVFQPEGVNVALTGSWRTENGRRILIVDRARPIFEPDVSPLRFVFFLSDGEVGNDDEIIDAVRANSGRTRVFTVGIGSSPNRSLLDAMAHAGRGASDSISLEGDSDATVERFAQRISTPVLTDIELVFSDRLEVIDTIPPLDAIPDLFDSSPLVIHGRYENAGEGTLTIRGRTGSGRYDRIVDLAFPEHAPDHDVIATLWAREKVRELMRGLARNDTRLAVVALGEQFDIMTKHTSFVAVEKSRLTIEGRPMLVAVPIEMPKGQSWSGTFGGPEPDPVMLGRQLMNQPTAEQARGVIQLGYAQLENSESAFYGLQARTSYPVLRHGEGDSNSTGRMNFPWQKSKGASAQTDSRTIRDLSDVYDLSVTTRLHLDADPALAQRNGPSESRATGRSRGQPAQWNKTLSTAGPGVDADSTSADDLATSLAGVPLAAKELRYQYGTTPSRGLSGTTLEASTESSWPYGISQRIDLVRRYGSDDAVVYVDLDAIRANLATRHLQEPAGAPLRAGVDIDELAAYVSRYGVLEQGESDLAETSQPPLSRIPVLGGAFVQAGQAAAPAGGVALLPDQIILLIRSLYRENRTDEAKALAQQLVAALPDFGPAVELNTALHDAAVSDEQREGKIDAIAERAAQRLAALIIEQRRIDRVARVLDSVFHAFAFGEELPKSLDETYDGPKPAGAIWRDGGVLVSILTIDTTEESLEALRDLGVQIEDHAESIPLVVGIAPLGRLGDLALHPAVRRIEPMRIE